MAQKKLAVKLITKNERIPVEVEGSTFFARRLTSAERESIIAQCTDKGVTNFGKVARLFSETAIVGWDNVTGDDNKEIPFDAELIEYLPEQVFLSIAEALNSLTGMVELTEKN